MEDDRDWKLKLRYGKVKTPYTHYTHYTAIGDGVIEELNQEYECPKGKAFMSIKTWATDTEESADMLRVIGNQIGFKASGKVEIYVTEAEQPPKENPFGYDIKFTPYD